MSMYIGEALVGDGNEISHIDLLIGSKDGPVGVAFANALANQSAGHSRLLAVVTPNLLCKPATVMITKVTIKGAQQAVQMFGPAQSAVARAVVDSVADGVIPQDKVDDLCLVVGVFIHWEATDDKKKIESHPPPRGARGARPRPPGARPPPAAGAGGGRGRAPPPARRGGGC